MPDSTPRPRFTLPTLVVIAALLIIPCGYFVGRAFFAPAETTGPNDGGAIAAKTPNTPGTSNNTPPKVAEHPLVPALKWAREIQANIDKNVQDYTCTFVKRERFDGKVGEPEHVVAKFRNEPFSVYMRFEKPEEMAGQEAIFVDGQNNNNLAGRGNGLKRLVGWVSFVPTGPIPMKNNHYPITEAGVRNLTKRLIEVAEGDLQYGECEVKFTENQMLNGASTTCVEVTHPVRRRSFLFHKARIYVDDQLKIPVRYEAYDWPEKPGDEPQLMEEYTYLNLKTNVGLTDADFNTATYK